LSNFVLLSIVGQLRKWVGERAACVKRERRGSVKTAKKALDRMKTTNAPGEAQEKDPREEVALRRRASLALGGFNGKVGAQGVLGRL